MESRANSLRAYAERLQEEFAKGISHVLDIEEISDDLLEFAEQWEAELINAKHKVKALIYPATMTEAIADKVIRDLFDGAGILIRPQVKLE